MLTAAFVSGYELTSWHRGIYESTNRVEVIYDELMNETGYDAYTVTEKRRLSSIRLLLMRVGLETIILTATTRCRR